MKSLDEVKKELNIRILAPDFSDLEEIYDWFSQLEIKDIESHFAYEDENYCRIPLLARDEYDLLICCWKPGQKSAFHGHPNQGCLVKILKGTTTEEIQFADGSLKTRQNPKGTVGYINDSIGIHRVWNASDENTVSLHLYSPGGYYPVFK